MENYNLLRYVLEEGAFDPTKPDDDPDASGYDIRAFKFVTVYTQLDDNLSPMKVKLKDFIGDTYTLAPNERILVKTGIRATIGKGFELQIRGRSGLALKHGISIAGGMGTIDSAYRGDIGVILINHGTNCFRIDRGDRIAQMVPAIVPPCKLKKVEFLEATDRGDKGFGHSGLK